MCVRARKKSTKSRGTACFGNGFSLSSCKASNCPRALAIGDLSPSKGGGSGVTSASHSQMHSLTHLRGSRTEDGGMSVNRSGSDESDHLRHKRGNRSPRDWCGTRIPFSTDVRWYTRSGVMAAAWSDGRDENRIAWVLQGCVTRFTCRLTCRGSIADGCVGTPKRTCIENLGCSCSSTSG